MLRPLAWISTEDCSPKRGAVFGGRNTWSERRGAPGTCGFGSSRLLKEAADLLMSFGALRRISWKHIASILFWWLELKQSFLAFKNGHDSDIGTRFAFHAVARGLGLNRLLLRPSAHQFYKRASCPQRSPVAQIWRKNGLLPNSVGRAPGAAEGLFLMLIVVRGNSG